ncbi:unnamed protein product [Ranitomeya imitator]|uniref:Uncharacterized protein n=1 Tax=Ranitomeya imitator TaxID=111125 RepID=A0ABN9M9I0_9NEOB|nr:unnamed protein product [Ranitomeya imitator]
METNFSTVDSSFSKQTLYALGFQPLDLGEWTFITPTLLVLIGLLGFAEEFKEGFKDVWKHINSKKTLDTKDKDEDVVKDLGALTPDVPPDSTSFPDLVPERPTINGSIEQSCSQQNFGSQDSKENPVLPDVEQFWHEREANPSDQNNDPTPWEHEEDTVVSERSVPQM